MKTSSNHNFLGYLLISVGALIALSLLNVIYQLYSDPESGIFLSYMVAKLMEGDLFRYDVGSIKLGQGAAFFSSIFFLFLFSWVIVSIAFNFVKYGIYVLTSKAGKEANAHTASFEKIQNEQDRWNSN